MSVLLDYVFKVSSVTPTAEASTSFLKKVLVCCKPNGGGVDGTIYPCTSSAEIAAVTDNLDAVELLNAGMSSIFVLTVADLDIDDYIADHLNDFFTILISSDFSKVEIALLDAGSFEGVIGINTEVEADAADYAAVENQVGFYSLAANKAKNMFYAFGKLLSNAVNWYNQQFISMPKDDEIEALGDAEALFDDKVSFVITDDQYASRLALFAVGGKAIVAPYIIKNLKVDMQSSALAYISGNQPQYTVKEATLLENALKDKIDLYISREWIESGTVSVAVVDGSNFVATCEIEVPEPKALWRVFAEITQS
jgi:hypothetical protein